MGNIESGDKPRNDSNNQFIEYMFSICKKICDGDFLAQLHLLGIEQIAIENPREYIVNCLLNSMKMHNINPPQGWELWAYQHMIQHSPENRFLIAVTQALRPSDQEIQECPELYTAIIEAEKAARLARSITY
ncbi:MAG: hypothetical protein ACOCXP_01550 [Candidatus Dojkabacteria bacterium]